MKKNSAAFRLPGLKFKNVGINGFLVFSLVIFAFLLGMVTNKVIYLEQQLKNPPAAAAPTQDQAAAPTPPLVVKNLTNGHLPIQGNKNAKVTVIEFSDFQCPFCKAYFDQTAGKMNDTYIKTGKIKFVYRQFPLTSIHPNAQKAAEASECANEQGKFWEFHDLLFQNQDTWAPLSADDAAADWSSYAGQAGMDIDQFQSCFASKKYQKNVDDDVADGTVAQIDGTPTFFINGNRIVGAVPFAQLQQEIDKELKK